VLHHHTSALEALAPSAHTSALETSAKTAHTSASHALVASAHASALHHHTSALETSAKSAHASASHALAASAHHTSVLHHHTFASHALAASAHTPVSPSALFIRITTERTGSSSLCARPSLLHTLLALTHSFSNRLLLRFLLQSLHTLRLAFSNYPNPAPLLYSLHMSATSFFACSWSAKLFHLAFLFWFCFRPVFPFLGDKVFSYHKQNQHHNTQHNLL
jgi:hypothetical protein